MRDESFLGWGISFPPHVDKATGRFVMCGGEEDIKQAIYLILMTRKKEYMMLSKFGCSLFEYVFNLSDETSQALACNEIINSLIEWEPRIFNVSVTIDTEKIQDGKILFHIGYTVRATNHPENLVFPYYIYEGVGLE